MTSTLERYLSGECVFGDDLDLTHIEAWYAEEERGYYDLVDEDNRGYTYIYHCLNDFHFFRHLRGHKFARCLVLGCARGDDILPLASQIGEINAIEPAEKWWKPDIGGTPARYIKPEITGDIAFPDGAFDLVVCISALHHIPNVSHVLAELSRVTAKGGTFLLREPISSMGDWSKPRRGLTKNERGFPLPWLAQRFSQNNLAVRRCGLCVFPITQRLGHLFSNEGYDSLPLVILDALLSRAMGWNILYHRRTIFKKFAAGSAAFILKKT